MPAGWYPYSHWTYADQQVEDIQTSYMMARRLQVLSLLALLVQKYQY
jgi:hypothetical protein